MDEKPVVVGVDGSEHSRLALTWALGVAQRLDAPLLVAHVRSEALQLGEARIASLGPSPAIPDTVLNSVGAWIEQQDVRVPVRYESLDGTVPDALLDQARSARLLVVGSRGRGGFASLLLGSVSRSLATSAPCPVVVVPHEERTVPSQDAAEAGRVLVGLHPEETADEVLDFAFHAAAQRGVVLEVVTAYRLPPSPVLMVSPPAPALQVPPPIPLDDETPELVRDTARLQEERLRPFTGRYPDVTVSPAVVPADAAGRLVEDSRSAELVVVGRHRRHRVASLLMGSVAHAVLHHAHCPVAVVPAPTTDGS
ncbi:universal stress protein [Streptomyces sp. NPDC047981]|uniref:universal stress protein n=1 Tax=Streptomyces sp. NPDC047981 TaxID=3154610 RepID=UPI00343F622E